VVTRDFSGEDVVKVLVNRGNFYRDRTTGSHAILRYTHPETGEKRTVSVPMHDSITIGTLRNVARQAGAKDFEEFCKWIDRNR
jgi:predicted RNA binding protein YcfA (HicA-like mRNA interferase family)